MVTSVIFYMLSFILIASALFVITARNPVHSVLFLIVAFFNSAGLFILLGAEFVGMILAIVYVGAVAVLFLFVVMMLDVDFAGLRKGAMQYVPLGFILAVLLVAELGFVYMGWHFAEGALFNLQSPVAENVRSNTHALGAVLYTDYVLAFQVSGLILLVAMIGAIVLTLRKRPGVRKQNIQKQTRTKKDDVFVMHKIKPGQGV